MGNVFIAAASISYMGPFTVSIAQFIFFYRVYTEKY